MELCSEAECKVNVSPLTTLSSVAHRHRTRTEQGALTAMSRLVYYVFQPCLLFVKVASTVASPGHGIEKLLVLPFFALLQVFFGIILGKVRHKNE